MSPDSLDLFVLVLTLKAPYKNCRRRHLIFFYFYLSKKIRLDVSCESSARQRIHMKYQVLFSLKTMNKNSKLSSAAGVIGVLRVNDSIFYHYIQFSILKTITKHCREE